MAKNNALINKGVVVVGNPKSDKTSPIIVIGTARGGTSMVAGVLARLGVYMGGSGQSSGLRGRSSFWSIRA